MLVIAGLVTFFAVPLGYIIHCLLQPNPPPINGVYSQPGRWYTLKYWIFYFLFNIRKWRNKQRIAKDRDIGETGFGYRSKESEKAMEQIQELPPKYPKAVDAVYFNSGNLDEDFLVAATARRHNKLVQTLLYLRIHDLGLLELPSFPDTSLYSDKNEYAAGGLKIELVESMQNWKISFDGVLRLIPLNKETSELIQVNFTFHWTQISPLFDFDVDVHWKTICDAMAREKWSQAYFDKLQESHQTHYEQFGELKGVVNIEGHSERKITLHGVRDHSYGAIRDWADLHRYCLQYVTLENGTNICFGVICMRPTMTRLIMGYIFHKDGSKEYVTETDFEFYKFGDDGTSLKTMEVNFTTDSDKKYNMKIDMIDDPHFFMGLDWDAKVYERFCRFEVNGIKGCGISEWEYRAVVHS